MKRKLKKAFTITELVIVIAVIAILAAVLIPTFSNVVDNSKKSHDTQYAKELNVALNNYTIEHRAAPEDYEELMLALADAGLTDLTNPFLLATTLKQENAVLVWFPSANYIQLITTDEYSMIYEGTRGLGNGVGVYTQSSGDTRTFGYVLCNTGSKDSEYVASLYYDFYITCGGDIGAFAKHSMASGSYRDSMENKTWASAIESAINNHTQGYTYSESIAEKIEETLKDKASVDLDCLPSSNTSITKDTDFSLDSSQGGMTEEEKTAVRQSVRSTLATLSSLANDSSTKTSLSNKKITLNVPKNTTVDMSDTMPTAIGNSYRKDAEINGVDAKSTMSVDFGGLTLENFKVEENTFVSTGAEYQTGSDLGFANEKQGAYAFTYGLFGTVVARPGETVTIENINIKGVNMNLNGAIETVDGENLYAVSDMAGIIAGFTEGDVIFKNIHIDGSVDGKTKGTFRGYDGVGGVVGRSYKHPASSVSNTVTLENVIIENIAIEGQRRASALIGAAFEHVTLKKTNVRNVDVVGIRSDGGDQLWANLITDNNTYGSTIKVEDSTFENVTTIAKLEGAIGTNSDAADFNSKVSEDSYKTTYYYRVQHDSKNILLVSGGSAKLEVKGLTFKFGNEELKLEDKTYTPTERVDVLTLVGKE